MTLDKIIIPKLEKLNETGTQLPASKSISNRGLIIRGLTESYFQIHNLSEARDTQTMVRLLDTDAKELDVLDAGTTMRFLTAYLAVTNQHKILTGTPRMQERPISILVDALRKIGCDITYLKKDGFPPLEINKGISQKEMNVQIRGDVSSQYISALLMVAPVLPKGLVISLTGKIGSRPYINMTLAMLRYFGIASGWVGDQIKIQSQKYIGSDYTIEPDWSAASYWYSFAALSKNESLFINELSANSIQGDAVIQNIMEKLGVSTKFKPKGALLSKKPTIDYFEYDFSDCPDLAQTVAVICAVKGISAKFTGLESLKIKETNRVTALQNELQKLGARLMELEEHWSLIPSSKLPDKIIVDTYEDHRMAMAFAPLSTVMDTTIVDPSVVNKSYPGFWKEMQKAGFNILNS